MNPKIIPHLPMSQYLAMPAVSASIVKAVVDQCPRAGWYQSWLNAERPADDTAESDAGTIAHSILLEGDESGIVVIDPMDYPAEKTGAIPDGWTNKAIRAARDQARAAGKIPVLLDKYRGIRDLVVAVRGYLDSLKQTEPAIWAAFQPDGGDSELTVTWEHNGTPCRMRPDRISADRKLIVDLKTSNKAANPYYWEPDHTGAAFYRMGCDAAFGTQPDYVFLIVPQEPPYLPALVGCDPHQMELGREKVLASLDMWGKCVQTGIWPAWSTRVIYPEVKPWVESQWIERQMGHSYDYEAMFGRAPEIPDINAAKGMA